MKKLKLFFNIFRLSIFTLAGMFLFATEPGSAQKPMPLKEGFQLNKILLDEKLSLGIDIVDDPVRDNGKKGFYNTIGNVYKIWGTASNNFYGVGLNGSIVHWNGTTWRRLESGTSVSINDIWGAFDPQTGKQIILCAASNIADPGERKILRITEQNIVDTIPWIYWRRIHSIWFKDSKRIFTAGGGVWKGRINGGWGEFKDLPPYFTNRLRGQAINDIFVVGHFGLVSHYNGFAWRVYPEVAAALYYSCDYNDNIMVAVGDRNARAVALIMRKR